MTSSRSSRQSSSGSKKHQSSPSRSPKTKTDDWAAVTEPEERRRIQNRIAQRKFREKAREQRDRAERDARNQEHAGSSYHIPEPEEIMVDEELSGLPWGGPNLRYMVTRGHDAASQHSSRRASENVMDDVQYLAPYVGGYQQQTVWDSRDSSGGEERHYIDSPYYYDYDTSGGSSR